MEKSDFISVNCTLNPSSHHLINADSLSLCKPDAIIINTARGPIVEEQALIHSLEIGQIGGAALDVFEIEPLPLDSPLMKMDNVMLAPHNSNSSPYFWERVHWNTIFNLLKAFQIDIQDIDSLRKMEIA